MQWDFEGVPVRTSVGRAGLQTHERGAGTSFSDMDAMPPACLCLSFSPFPFTLEGQRRPRPIQRAEWALGPLPKAVPATVWSLRCLGALPGKSHCLLTGPTSFSVSYKKHQEQYSVTDLLAR